MSDCSEDLRLEEAQDSHDELAMHFNVGVMATVASGSQCVTQSTTCPPETTATTTTTVVSGQKRKEMAPRSDVWNHYNKFMNAEGNKVAQCKKCGKICPADSKGSGTSGLKSHLERCVAPAVNTDPKQTELRVYINPDGTKTVGQWKFDQTAIQRTVA